MAKTTNILICILLFICLPGYPQSGNVRDKVKQTYTNQIGVRELTGNNDGKSVEVYLKYVGLPKGNPWCAAFVCFSLGKNLVKNPRNGYSPALFPVSKVIYTTQKGIIKEPQPGDVFGIWFANKGRIAHVGFIDHWADDWVTTVEGNTNAAGSREGDGVYRKKRIKRQIYAVSNYID